MTLSLRRYAAHRGCALSSVQAAIRTGRLVGSVVKTDQGHAIVDAELADAEWAANTDHGRKPHAARAAAARRAGVPVQLLLRKAVAEELEEERRLMVELVTPLVDGAADALERAGRPATAAALEGILLAGQGEQSVEAVGELRDIVAGQTAGPVQAAARAAGAAIVARHLTHLREAEASDDSPDTPELAEP